MKRNETTKQTAMRIAKYIDSTGINNDDRYEILPSEIIALVTERDPFEAMLFAFEYGKAKGYRAALNEMNARNANRLYNARIATGYTLSEAAAASNITEEALTAYENGSRTPRDSVKIAIAKLYQKPVSELFF